MSAALRAAEPASAAVPVPVRAPEPGARYAARRRTAGRRDRPNAAGPDELRRVPLLLVATLLWALVALEIACLALVSA